MRNYRERKSERIIRRTAFSLTVVIYFILFTGIVFTNRPELLPEVVKEWLNIESPGNQKEIKKDLPLKGSNKKDRA
jgi:hypothetical protein